MLDCEEAKVVDPEKIAAQQLLEEESKQQAANSDDVSISRVDGDTQVNTVLHLKTEFAEVYRKFS